MQKLAVDLKAVGAESTIIGIDLGKDGAAADLTRDIETRGLAVDVLINATGLGANGPFGETDPDRIATMLQVNVVALTELTRLMLPGMVARQRGSVLLVASTAAFQPGPQMAVYCASKAYILSFGEAIAYEMRGTGVTVTTLCPGPTATGFAHSADAEGTALFTGIVPVMQSAEVARIGYRGLKAGRAVVVTGLLNNIFAISGRISPPSMSLPIVNWMMQRGR